MIMWNVNRSPESPTQSDCDTYWATSAMYSWLVEPVLTMKNNWVVIGLSGVTNGGKSTLAQWLQVDLCKTLSLTEAPFLFIQDNYFWPEDSDKHVLVPELKHANWDIVSSLDMDRLHADVERIVSQPANGSLGIILVEGHLILNHRNVSQLFDLKYYFRLSKEQCWERRKMRAYEPPDPPGYFEKCVWPMYEMYREEVENQCEGVVFLDGNESKKETFHKVLQDIKAFLGAHGLAKDESWTGVSLTKCIINHNKLINTNQVW